MTHGGCLVLTHDSRSVPKVDKWEVKDEPCQDEHGGIQELHLRVVDDWGYHQVDGCYHYNNGNYYGNLYYRKTIQEPVLQKDKNNTCITEHQREFPLASLP